MRKLIFVLLCAGSVWGAIHYVSSTGTDTWANSTSIDKPCALATANTYLATGDTVYIRGGTYSLTVSDFAGAIQPANSGTLSNRIAYIAYANETPLFINATTHPGPSPKAHYTLGINIANKSYIIVKGIKFQDWDYWGRCYNQANYNEIAYCEFYNTTDYYNAGGSELGFQIYGSTTLAGKGSKHNWFHHNTLHDLSLPPPREGGDLIKIGSYNQYDIDSDYNTIEDNVFYHAGHTCTDNFCRHNVWRRNFAHNEGFKVDPPHLTGINTGGGVQAMQDNAKDFTSLGVGTSIYVFLHDLDSTNAFGNLVDTINGITTVTNPNDNLTTANTFSHFNWTNPRHHYDISSRYFTTSSQPSESKYAHRCFHFDAVYGRAGCDTNLMEGNRASYSSPNPANNGWEGYSFSSGSNIFRFNTAFGNSGSGFYFKNGLASSNNRIYNNTFYKNGLFDGRQDAVTPVIKGGMWFANNASVYNVIKNNCIIGNSTKDIITSGTGIAASTVWYKNWCKGGATYSSVDSANPQFTDTTLFDYTNANQPNLRLKSTSPMIDKGGALTVTSGTGTNSTSLVVADAMYFQDGTWGSDLNRGTNFFPDKIAIGSVKNVAAISSISYSTNTITLSSANSWSSGDSVWLFSNSAGDTVLRGKEPDIGAYEYYKKATQTIVWDGFKPAFLAAFRRAFR